MKKEYHVGKYGSVYPKFKTVDECVLYVMNLNSSIKPRGGDSYEEYIISHIATSLSDMLLFALQQKTNIPSKYDLLIINKITHCDVISEEQSSILEIYNNRK